MSCYVVTLTCKCGHRQCFPAELLRRTNFVLRVKCNDDKSPCVCVALPSGQMCPEVVHPCAPTAAGLVRCLGIPPPPPGDTPTMPTSGRSAAAGRDASRWQSCKHTRQRGRILMSRACSVQLKTGSNSDVHHVQMYQLPGKALLFKMTHFYSFARLN